MRAAPLTYFMLVFTVPAYWFGQADSQPINNQPRPWAVVLGRPPEGAWYVR